MPPTPQTPSAPSPLRLPYPLAHAALMLDAPAADWTTLGDFVAWAETSLRFPVSCCPIIDPATGRRRGALRHQMTINPHTGATAAAPTTETEAAKVAAKHTLWALTHTPTEPPACMRVEAALARWVGPVHPGEVPTAPGVLVWPRTSTNERMRAVRSMVRGVQYLDHDLDVWEDADWLGIGVRPDLVTWTRALLSAVGHPRSENRLVGFLEHKVGARGTLKPGQKAVADEVWLLSVVKDWVMRTFHVSYQSMAQMQPPDPWLAR